MRIYLDNCCFNRPFDDQGQTRIRLEAEAKLCLQDGVRMGSIEIVWSYILEYENGANPFKERRKTILDWKEQAVILVEESADLLAKAVFLKQLGLRPKDCLHLACAIAGECDYFVTTDDRILSRGRQMAEIKVVDPIGLVKEMRL